MKLAILLLAFSACISSREKAINATLGSLNASSQAFQQYDAIHQQSIVTEATSKDEGVKNLSEWREKRSVIESTFVAAYRLCATAAVLDDDPSLQGLLSAWNIVQKELLDLGVKLP